MTMLFSMLANRHHSTRNVRCQPGDGRWPVNLPRGKGGGGVVWVCMGKHAHHHPQGYCQMKACGWG